MDCLIVTNLCYGVIRDMSFVSCVDKYKVINRIINISSKFDFCYIINDQHSIDDKEFSYLPPHLINTSSDIARIDAEKKIACKYKQFLTKKSLSAINSEHNKRLIVDSHFDRICVAGFCACMDIVPTCLDLIDSKQNVFIMPSAIGDISCEMKDKAISYLDLMGIKIEED